MSTQLYFRDPFGNMQTIIKKFSRLEYMRGENKIGWLTLDVNPAKFDTHLLRVDERIEPWRRVGARAPYLDGESIFFLRDWEREIDTSGIEVLRLYAWDANYLHDSRNIAYAAGSAAASKTTTALDNVMKAIVRENMGASATDTSRSLAAYVSVQADLTQAPTSSKDCSRAQVIDTLQALALDSKERGTYLAFDTVYVNATALEFRTYTGQRGVNHGRTSGNQIVISRERKNLEQPRLRESHSEEYNYIYAGGQGTKENRTICTANNAAAIGLSPFNRREKFVDARNSETTDAVQGEANAALQQYRAKKTLTGLIKDTDGCRDGVHYKYGDLVYAEAWGQGFDAHLDTLHVIIENGRETRENQIRGEAVV